MRQLLLRLNPLVIPLSFSFPFPISGAGWTGNGFAPGSEAEVAKLPGRLARYLAFMKARAQQHQVRQTEAAAAPPKDQANASPSPSPPSTSVLPPKQQQQQQNPPPQSKLQPKKSVTPSRLPKSKSPRASSPAPPKTSPPLQVPEPAPAPMDPDKAALIAEKARLQRRLDQLKAIKTKTETLTASFVLYSSLPRVEAKRYACARARVCIRRRGGI